MRPTREKNIENEGFAPAPQGAPSMGRLLCSHWTPSATSNQSTDRDEREAQPPEEVASNRKNFGFSQEECATAHSCWCLHCCTSKTVHAKVTHKPSKQCPSWAYKRAAGVRRVGLPVAQETPLKGKRSVFTNPQSGLDLGWRMLFLFSSEGHPPSHHHPNPRQTNPFWPQRKRYGKRTGSA